MVWKHEKLLKGYEKISSLSTLLTAVEGPEVRWCKSKVFVYSCLISASLLCTYAYVGIKTTYGPSSLGFRSIQLFSQTSNQTQPNDIYTMKLSTSGKEIRTVVIDWNLKIV